MLYSHFIKTGIFFPRVRREIHWTHEINKTYKPREIPKTFKPGKVPLKATDAVTTAGGRRLLDWLRHLQVVPEM